MGPSCLWTALHSPGCRKDFPIDTHTVYPKKHAHGCVVLCFVVVTQSFIMNSHEVFIHIHQGCFAGTGAIVRLPHCQWSKPDGYGKISQCIITTKHSKAKTVCIFLGIYCRLQRANDRGTRRLNVDSNRLNFFAFKTNNSPSEAKGVWGRGWRKWAGSHCILVVRVSPLFCYSFNQWLSLAFKRNNKIPFTMGYLPYFHYQSHPGQGIVRKLIAFRCSGLILLMLP